MSWIIASLLMFFSSAATYVLIRKGQKIGISTMTNSMAMFILPIPLLFLYAVSTGQSLLVSPIHLLWLFGTALFLSWLGNLFSLKSIEQSPNPGYSLIISKSYVVYTSFASIFLFHSPLSMLSLVAIGLILGFSALIILGDRKKQKVMHSLSWFWLSLGAFFCWGTLALVSKFLLNEGVSVAARLFYVFFFVGLILIAESLIRKEKIQFGNGNLPVLLGIGLFGMLSNLFMQLGFQYSPNPGFINAVNAASIVLVTILATFFFKDELNRTKLIGVLGVTVGLFLLFLA